MPSTSIHPTSFVTCFTSLGLTSISPNSTTFTREHGYGHGGGEDGQLLALKLDKSDISANNATIIDFDSEEHRAPSSDDVDGCEVLYKSEIDPHGEQYDISSSSVLEEKRAGGVGVGV